MDAIKKIPAPATPRLMETHLALFSPSRWEMMANDTKPTNNTKPTMRRLILVSSSMH
jgi:hypothetical protein